MLSPLLFLLPLPLLLLLCLESSERVRWLRFLDDYPNPSCNPKAAVLHRHSLSVSLSHTHTHTRIRTRHNGPQRQWQQIKAAAKAGDAEREQQKRNKKRAKFLVQRRSTATWRNNNNNENNINNSYKANKTKPKKKKNENENAIWLSRWLLQRSTSEQAIKCGEGEREPGRGGGEKNVGLVLQKCKMNKNRFTDYTVLYFSFCADLRLVDRRQSCRVRNENIKKVRKTKVKKKGFYNCWDLIKVN